MSSLLEPHAIGAVRHHAEGRVDTALAQALERDQHVVRALDRSHASDPADREAAFGDAQIVTTLDPAVLRGRDSLVELDPESNHGEPLPRRDTEGDEVVTHLGTDRDECSRSRGEPTLQEAEEERA